MTKPEIKKTTKVEPKRITKDIWIYQFTTPFNFYVYKRTINYAENAKAVQIHDLHMQIKITQINTTEKFANDLSWQICSPEKTWLMPKLILDRRDDAFLVQTLQKVYKENRYIYYKLNDKFKTYSTLSGLVNKDVNFTWYGETLRQEYDHHYLWSYLIGNVNYKGCVSKSLWHKERKTGQLYCDYGMDSRIYFKWEDVNSTVFMPKGYLFVVLLTERNDKKALQLLNDFVSLLKVGLNQFLNLPPQEILDKRYIQINSEVSNG